MSALGETTAVISIGCSCQTAMQVDSQLQLLSSIVGEPLARASLPYDWLIMPPSALVSWISAGHGFPTAPDEIVAHPNFNWPRHGLHFWHEFVRDGEARVAESFADTRAKFDHLFSRFASLAQRRRRIWIYSNTQNNLDVVQSVAPALDFRLDALTITSMTAAVTSLFDFGTDEFLFLCRDDRADPHASDAGWPVRILQADDSEVAGDALQWAAAFRDLIPSRVGVAAEPFLTNGADIMTASSEHRFGPFARATAAVDSEAARWQVPGSVIGGGPGSEDASRQRRAAIEPMHSTARLGEDAADRPAASANPREALAPASRGRFFGFLRGQRA